MAIKKPARRLFQLPPLTWSLTPSDPYPHLRAVASSNHSILGYYTSRAMTIALDTRAKLIQFYAPFFDSYSIPDLIKAAEDFQALTVREAELVTEYGYDAGNRVCFRGWRAMTPEEFAEAKVLIAETDANEATKAEQRRLHLIEQAKKLLKEAGVEVVE